MIIGKIISISYSLLKVKISSEIRGGAVNLRGEIYYFGNIGSYLKTQNAVDEVIICEVISIFDTDVQSDRASFDIESNRELSIKPVGTIKQGKEGKEFTLGVGIFPSLYSDVSIVEREDMGIVLAIKKLAAEQNGKGKNVVHEKFYLGMSKNLINYKIHININNFFNIHSAVLGNTGSGKSNTIAHIIQEIHKNEKYSALGSRILLFDVSGEYAEAFPAGCKANELCVRHLKPHVKPRTQGKGKQNESLNQEETKPFYLPHFLMSLDEWCAFLLASDATQRPFWDRVLQESYRFYSMGHKEDEKKQRQLVYYFASKACDIADTILSQANSDTNRITSVNAILGRLISLCQKDKKLGEAGEKHIDGKEISLEAINIGTKRIPNFIKAFHADFTLLNVLKGLQQRCEISYGENKDALSKAIKEIKDKINNKYVNEVREQKYEYGTYFDYRFLKTGADIVIIEEDARGNKNINTYVATMLARLDYFLENPDCAFMRHSDSNSLRSEKEYLDWLWGDGNHRKQMVIIDTSEIGPDILETLSSVVSRLLFDNRKKLEGEQRREKPIHLVLDEAHRYVKKDHDYILKENIFEKIAREGRKYSLYLLLSSQRPSELSETTLSQCANFIVHRIHNKRDMEYIGAVLPYFSEDFINKIKLSVPGEALVFGNCVAMPLHIMIEKARPEPNSKNCNISKEWFISKEILLSKNKTKK